MAISGSSTSRTSGRIFRPTMNAPLAPRIPSASKEDVSFRCRKSPEYLVASLRKSARIARVFRVPERVVQECGDCFVLVAAAGQHELAHAEQVCNVTDRRP